ncbi:PEP-CTERM sorting domain-containing protein [Microcystis flos-aquae FACHB-1344]|uniref:PEP-CTERM sorting domain-containing protein n=1 Tax=Microcystis flos-aquae FACHB-1344 TaxID=2692899 RepID=A0ABR8HN95_9CHRO|nr:MULTISPECIES: PEP-CTERM sorting domain-containing protein [Microcystis]MBD2620415.1 PEP-CTERM sorting domain-containing protein [Microcystis flos-aquae FACHB-1344]MCA2702213.1 PEP-CTERM sorting domain-containing protein [Microcystis sp. M179S2]
MKITHKLLFSSWLLLGVTVAPSQVLAGPFVPQGPFVQPAPGPHIPWPKNVPGKEYSDRFDKDTQEPPVLDPEQNIYWDGNGGRQDAFDYSGSRSGDTDPAREVDALANHQDALFWDVIANQAALLFSTGSTTLLLPGDSRATVYNASPAYNQLGIHEKSVLSESIGGGIGFWAKPPEIDQAGVNDLDGLEVWGGLADPTPDDADVYSLLGDPLINGTRTSLWYYNGGVSNPYLDAAQIAAAINRPDIANLANIIDLDGLMVWDGGNIGQWDNSDAILFSVMPIDANLDGIITPNINGGDIDGGEIWHWQFGQAAQFLNHGGHLWDTAFNVRQATGAVNENIDALEAVASSHNGPRIPEPSTVISLLTLGTLGAASTLKRKLKSSKFDEN